MTLILVLSFWAILALAGLVRLVGFCAFGRGLKDFATGFVAQGMSVLYLGPKPVLFCTQSYDVGVVLARVLIALIVIVAFITSVSWAI